MTYSSKKYIYKYLDPLELTGFSHEKAKRKQPFELIAGSNGIMQTLPVALGQT